MYAIDGVAHRRSGKRDENQRKKEVRREKEERMDDRWREKS